MKKYQYLCLIGIMALGLISIIGTGGGGGGGGVVPFYATYIVTNTEDSGEGSLRAAIESANDNDDLDLISFNIPGLGPHTIQPLSALPDIIYPVVIDGYTQPGATPATESDPAALIIEIDGSRISCYELHYCSCLTIHADNSTVRGLVINRCDDAGIHIDSSNGGNIIEGNYIGTDVTGTIKMGSWASGVRIWNSPDNIIGGTTPAARNVISGSFGSNGVEILLSEAENNIVQGNYIGTDVSGTEALGNSHYGVNIKQGASYNTIGPDNVISGNGEVGIYLNGEVEPVLGNSIVNNLIGTDAFGKYNLELGNHPGIHLLNCDNSTFIENTVTGSAFNGILISNSENNTFTKNTVTNNTGNGVVLNDESNFNTFVENVAQNNGRNGFRIDNSSGNSLIGNISNGNGDIESGGFGYVDHTEGMGTSGTDNAYSENNCETNSSGGSDPTGLCSPQP